MKSKWTASIVFLVGLVLIDQGVAWVLDRGVRAGLGRDVVRRVQHATTAVDTNIFITGSSRAVNHLDPSALEEELGVDVLSVACLGQRVVYSRMVQAILFDSGVRPDVFVLQVSAIDMFELAHDKANVLMPFVHRSPDAREILKRGAWQNHLKLLSGSYRYNSQVVGMLTAWLRPKPLGDGFDPVPEAASHRRDDNPYMAVPMPGAKYEPAARELIHDFVTAARDVDCDVVMIAGPRYWAGVEPTAEYNEGLDRLEAIAAELDVPFHRFTRETHPEFANPEYFTNSAHLNLRGADRLTRLLAAEIRPILLARASREVPKQRGDRP